MKEIDIGKSIEVERMVQQLKQVRQSSTEEVWNCCAHLYTKDSFLYKTINEIMRLVGNEDENDKKKWKSKISTFGPFVWLLYWLREENGLGSTITVYRGAELADDLIANFRNAKHNTRYEFPGFTSTSTDQEVAELYSGNVIFHIDISLKDGNDLSLLSQFPDEKEFLLVPAFLFQMKSCIYNDNKWNIHLASFWADSYSTSSSESSDDSFS